MSNDTMTPLKNAVRVFNKHVLNPAMMNLAGRKHWYAAVIRHTGRRSGKSYATPVVADRVADGFILPLPYGTSVDWLRNVLAAGRETVTVGGETFDVPSPKSSTPQPPCLSCRHVADMPFNGSASTTS